MWVTLTNLCIGSGVPLHHFLLIGVLRPLQLLHFMIPFVLGRMVEYSLPYSSHPRALAHQVPSNVGLLSPLEGRPTNSGQANLTPSNLFYKWKGTSLLSIPLLVGATSQRNESSSSVSINH